MASQQSDSNGSGSSRVLDRLAAISYPALLGALGIVLWSMLSGVVAGLRDSEAAIAGLRTTVENLATTVTERTGDRWTATQEAQQQVIQALVDTAQNGQLIEARTDLRQHQMRLEAIAVEMAVGNRRLEALELGTAGSADGPP